MNDFCVVIPAFNEEKNLRKLLEELKKYVDKSKIIVIDDGSKDNTKTIAESSGVCVIFNERNMGKGKSLRKGFDEAIKRAFLWIITIDADLQHQSSEINKFLEKAKNGDSDLIIGNRMGNIKNMPYHRILSNKITSFLISLRIGQKVKDSQCGFRMINRKVIEKISLFKNHFSLESELLLKAGLNKFKIDSVEIKTIYNDSKSNISPIRDIFGFIFVYISSFFWGK